MDKLNHKKWINKPYISHNPKNIIIDWKYTSQLNIIPEYSGYEG